ncbi:Kri1-like C-terminal domain-containing protein [[Candida] zeylanoides]
MARKKSAAKRAKEAAAVEPVVEKEVRPSSEDEAEDSDDSEEEDEYGELITSNIEDGINKVLDAIKHDPSKLLDPNVKFYDEAAAGGADGGADGATAPKPMYLKDYHRMNLLSGGYKDESVDGEKPFVVTEREDRNQLLADIKSAFSDEEDGDFLQKKSRTRPEVESALPDPRNEEEFLNAFVDKKAWIPTPTDRVIDLDRGDDAQFDDAAEEFEHAYNFRYEDPNAAQIMSYARSQATLRRDATNARKRQREREHLEKEAAEQQQQQLLRAKKQAKVNEVADRLHKIKQAVGAEVPDAVIERVFGQSLLNDDFDDADWDAKMAQIFDEQYYEGGEEKPTWSDEEPAEPAEPEAASAVAETSDATDAGPSKKDKRKQKKSAQKLKDAVKERAAEIVEKNTLKVLGDVAERGRSPEPELKFRYREVSPETFGLTTRDIILADDKQLNEYIGLKKFAPYRPKELRLKDKRKYTKSKHLKEWRRQTFGRGGGGGDDDEIWIPEGAPKKKRKER